MAKNVKPPTAEDLMIRDVLTVSTEADLDEAITTLIKHSIPSLPVVEDKNGGRELIGFITEKDCLEYFANEIYYGNPNVDVPSMMQRFPLCVPPETDVFALASIFTRHPHRHLPVVIDKQLVGIVSRRDVLRGLYEFERKVCADRAERKGRSLRDFRHLVNLRFLIK